MIKVGFFLDNSRIGVKDLSQPEMGNPGIGGTQFNFITLPYYLKKFHPLELNCVLYANEIRGLPGQVECVQVDGLLDAAIKSEKDECQIFIFRPTNHPVTKKFLKSLNDFNFHVICWIHNTPDIFVLNMMSGSDKVKRYVCVGEEQLDMVRDHSIFYKGIVIFNGFDPQNYIPENKINKNNNEIVFLGGLTPEKGFLSLARVWKKVLKKKPEAKLKVIGTGALYNRNQKLGEWKIAEEKFELKIRKYLSNKDGSLIDSVEFLGLLGREKIPILQKAGVGVVNPTGKTENCPGSAIEIQAAGTPVVSGANWGLLDTVIDKKTGLLGKNNNELINHIVYLLNNPSLAEEMGYNGISFVKEKFNYKKICNDWVNLFNDIIHNVELNPKPVNQNPYYKFKFLREWLRKLKKYIPLFQFIPSIYGIKSYLFLLKSWFKRK